MTVRLVEQFDFWTELASGLTFGLGLSVIILLWLLGLWAYAVLHDPEPEQPWPAEMRGRREAPPYSPPRVGRD